MAAYVTYNAITVNQVPPLFFLFFFFIHLSLPRQANENSVVWQVMLQTLDPKLPALPLTHCVTLGTLLCCLCLFNLEMRTVIVFTYRVVMRIQWENPQKPLYVSPMCHRCSVNVSLHCSHSLSNTASETQWEVRVCCIDELNKEQIKP